MSKSPGEVIKTAGSWTTSYLALTLWGCDPEILSPKLSLPCVRSTPCSLNLVLLPAMVPQGPSLDDRCASRVTHSPERLVMRCGRSLQHSGPWSPASHSPSFLKTGLSQLWCPGVLDRSYLLVTELRTNPGGRAE